MRKMKKFMSLLLAAVMVLSVMTVNVFAEETGTITVVEPEETATYKIYKMFDLTMHGTNSFAYRVDSDWEAFFTGNGAGTAYITLDDNGYIASAPGPEATADAAALAVLAAEYAKDLTADKTDKGNTVTFTGLDLGYYLVASTFGSNGICALTTTKPDAEVDEKNIKPVLAKYVEEGEDNWVEENDAQRNTDVNFKITVTNLEGDISTYEVEDVMSEYFTLDFSSIKVFLNEDEVNTFDITETENGFTVEFADLETEVDDVISITYTAELNADAPVNAAILNTATLTYDSEEGDEELVDTTNTFTWDLDVFKYTGNKEALEGAKFVLRDAKEDKDANYYCFDGEKYFWDADDEYAIVLESGANGLTEKMEGLDSGTYYLEETAAPDGYNMLTERVKVEINADGTVDGAGTKADVEVLNNAGALLPETGGIGTMIFRVGGAALIIIAGALLVAKKRTNNI